MQRGVTRVERVDTEKVAVLKYLFLWLKMITTSSTKKMEKIRMVQLYLNKLLQIISTIST